MRFELTSLSTLPRLAWLARIREGNPVVRVAHGSWVETREDFFVEGAWDAPFAAGAFDRTDVLAGSGGRITPHGVVFATPTNMYERLYSVRTDDEVLVSNSLAFLLAQSGDRLDPAHPHYYLDLLDLFRIGIVQKQKRLRLAGGRSVQLHDCCNLAVGPDGELTRIEKPWGAPPASYDDYVALLGETLRRVFDNAGDDTRRWRYRPLAMVSQGYDSTAVAALASRAGCREAVTFVRSGRGFRRADYLDDSGEAVGRSLGLTVTSYERNDHEAMPGFRAEEFYLEPWGVDRTMAVMEEQLVGSLLLSGRSGETVWTRGDLRWGRADFEYPVDFTGGCALGEFRLRTGFLHFPPATIAAVHAHVIHRWNATPELRPWSIGGRYDKPIARRIAEEAGVPRQLFGQLKMGGHQRPESNGTLAERVRFLSYWPRTRALVLRTVGNRLHTKWKPGSFEIQEAIARMIERYREAIASVPSSTIQRTAQP